MTLGPSEDETRRSRRSTVAALFAVTGVILVVLIWRVFGGS